MRIPIQSDFEESLYLEVLVDVDSESVIQKADFESHLEAEYQLFEAHSYAYELSDKELELRCEAGVVKTFPSKHHMGHIHTGNYVGTLQLEVFRNGLKTGKLQLEVRSYKADYRAHYQEMLNLIAKESAELILQHSSPVVQNLTFDFEQNPQTLYQRFTFVRSIIESIEFEEAVHRVLTMPVTNWVERAEHVDTRRAGRLGASAVRAFTKGQNRYKLPDNHPLRSVEVSSIPVTIPRKKRFETVDTPENRFVLFALTTFQQFCADVAAKLKEERKTSLEAEHATSVVEKLEGWLNHSIFKEIGFPSSIPLNSPVLQRKEGYREVFHAWLMLDLAAKLIWEAGDEVYSAGKRDVAKLYEYWVFFKLLNLFDGKFELDEVDKSKLIAPSPNGLALELKRKQQLDIYGIYHGVSRDMNVRFSYNRKFKANRPYPNSGSWTLGMHPDYTISFWPMGTTESKAEQVELIVHIHFDAKYKVDQIVRLDELDDEEEDSTTQVGGKVKAVDIIKMHAYKDAIRRTGGAYILYPGDDWQDPSRGFREIIPGLGAFPLRPTESDGIAELEKFIDEVLNHLENRATQREAASFHNYRIHKEGPTDALHEALPEVYDGVRAEPVDEVSVLVGAFRDDAQLDWIVKKLYYNLRTGKRGDFDLGPNETGSKFLLLHGNGERQVERLYRIIGHREGKVGPRIFSKEKMADHGYPLSKNPAEYYAVFKLSEDVPKELQNMRWDLSKLEGYGVARGSKFPFSVTLKELMAAKV